MTQKRADTMASEQRRRIDSYLMRVELFLSYMEDLLPMVDESIATGTALDKVFKIQWESMKKKFEALKEE